MVTDPQLDLLKHTLEGTCQTLETVLERLEIEASVEEAEDRLLDGEMAIECCSQCGWWHECAILEFSDEHNGPVCRDCEPELFE